MKHPILIGLSAAALLGMLLVLLAAPEFVKANPILFWVVFLAGVVRLVSWLAASSEETKVEDQILARYQETERITEAAGQAVATIWLYRVSSWVGRAVPIDIYCDRAAIASLDNASCALCKVVPGRHAFSAPAMDSLITLNLDSEQEYFIKANMVRRGHALEAVSKDLAESEMKTL